jgi:ADP-ribose pyrophosphatase YjhB (NUDIX family)
VILHCTRKKRKPPHYQLPGGHVDDCEFKQITKSISNLVTQEQLYYAARIGCAREVYEETGIDFRNRLEEFLPMVLYNKEQEDFKNETLINEYKSRIFFVCEVFDEDFPCAVRKKAKKYAIKIIGYYLTIAREYQIHESCVESTLLSIKPTASFEAHESHVCQIPSVFSPCR